MTPYSRLVHKQGDQWYLLSVMYRKLPSGDKRVYLFSRIFPMTALTPDCQGVIITEVDKIAHVPISKTNSVIQQSYELTGGRGCGYVWADMNTRRGSGRVHSRIQDVLVSILDNVCAEQQLEVVKEYF